MKKIITIAIAAVMLVSVLSAVAFAAADDTNIILEIGNVFGELKQSDAVDCSKSGEYTLTATVDNPCSTSEDASFIAVKSLAGNFPQATALPDGTVVTVTALEIDGTKVELDPEKSTKTISGGIFNDNDGVCLLFKMGGLNALTGNVPESFKTVKVTFTVENPESPADSAPAEDNTPADSAPAEDNTPADSTPEAPKDEAPAKTGIVLAVLPMMAAAAAVVVSKKR